MLTGGRWRSVLLRVLTGVMVLGLVLAGCGDDGADAGPGTQPEPEPQPAPEPDVATVEVEVFFAVGEQEESCDEVAPVTRDVPADDVLTGALEALLEGPTETERSEGFGGWFSSATAGMLLGAEAIDGTAHVDLDDLREVIPNASSSCGSQLLLAQLDRTVHAAVEVDRVVYAIEGDPETLSSWLQYDVPAEGAGDRGVLTVEQVIAALEHELEADALTPREVTFRCDATGPLAVGDVFVCSLTSEPPEPADWGSQVIAVLSPDVVAWSSATDNPGSTQQLLEAYAASPHGLTCAELRDGGASFPFDVDSMDEVGAFFWSVVYWNLEGQPARMDADGDGVPCGTLYPDGARASALVTLP